MSNVQRFLTLLAANGQTATFHREMGGTACPCRTPEGYRSPAWHEDNPLEPVCNEEGFLSPTVQEVAVRAFIQPIQSSHATRLSDEAMVMMFGEVQTDDHLGIFPLVWNSTALDFYDWGNAGEDFILFDGRRFTVVNVNKIPDPSGGGFHHWEVALRLMRTERPA